MTTAFVLAGGGSLGAVQVGMLQALSRARIHPDLLVGTSAGALNAAWVAGHGTSSDSLAGLAEVWGGLHRHDIFPLSPQHLLHGVLGTSPAVCSPDRLIALIRRHVGFEDLRDALIPVHVVATDLLSGRSVLLSDGPLATAVQASAAIPGIFPPVLVDGHYLVDGGVAEQSGVAQAVALGADEIYVLPAGVACALQRPPRTAVGVAIQALSVLIAQRSHTEVAAVEGRPGGPVVRVLPPLCPLAVAASDFRHARALIGRGRRTSEEWLRAGGPDLPVQARFLSLHAHRPGDADPLPPSPAGSARSGPREPVSGAQT